MFHVRDTATFSVADQPERTYMESPRVAQLANMDSMVKSVKYDNAVRSKACKVEAQTAFAECANSPTA